MRFFLLLLLIPLTSCSWIPGSTVRVAAPSEVQASPAWKRLIAALPAGTFEVVTPDAFPPADLVWFDAGSEPSDHALAANASVEALGRESGVPAVWFAADADRVFPVAWSPWIWWKGEPGSLVPTAIDQAVLAAVEARLQPAVGEPKTPEATGKGRSWLPAARVALSPARTSLTPEDSPLTAARVLGFVWDERGWNAAKVPDFLRTLWSPAVQGLWASDPEWLPVTRPDTAPKALLLVR